MIFREVEDRDLILRSQKGDVDAFNILVSRWERRVYNYLLRNVGNREDALDLAQDTFLKVYRGLPKLSDIERFPQWLFRIAHNEAVSLFRRNRMQFDDTETEQMEAPGAGRPERISSVEAGLAVERALETLSPEQREVVTLKVYQGFKFHEIAAIVGCPVSTVKSRLYTAFDLLKGILTPVGSAGGA